MTSTLFTSMLQISVTTGIVIVALLLFSSLLNKKFIVKWKYWVWLVLAIRLLIPVNLSLPQAPVQLPVPDAPVRQSIAVPQPDMQAVANIPAPAEQPVSSVPVAAGNSVTVMDVAAAVWLAGIGLFLLYHAVSYLWCRWQCLRWSRPVNGTEPQRMLEEICTEMKIRTPPVLLVSEKVTSPMVIGFFRSYLLLPAVEYSTEDLNFIMKHEMVHLKRGDLWYKLILLAANALHWFNPAVYLMFHEAGKDLELACDDEVVRGLSYDGKREYSEAIIRSIHKQRNRTALTTYFYGGTKTMKERFANILGKHKKRNGIILGAVILACAAAAGSLIALNAVTVFPSEEYDSLYKKYVQSMHVGMVANSTWDDPNEVNPEYYTYYYAAEFLQAGGSFDNYEIDNYDVMIPAEELEAYVQAHFDVTVSHLRESELYEADKNAYRFGGLGSAVDFVVTAAEKRGNMLYLNYDVNGGQGYRFAKGKLVIEQKGENYKYLSNEFERSAEYYLAYPSAIHISATNGSMVINSGGESSITDRQGNVKSYDGTQLDSVISYYEDEALPAMEAQGTADTAKYADGWYWSGTYRGGIPLTIDVQRKFGGETYIITATYEENGGEADRSEVDTIRLDWLDNLYSDYVYRPYYAGVLDSTWEVPFNIFDKGSLVRMYALTEDDGGSGELRYPTADVDAFLERYFEEDDLNMIRYSVWYDEASDTYHSDKGFEERPWCRVTAAQRDGDRLVLSYKVHEPENEEALLWEGQLTVILSSSGYKYASNYMWYPKFPIGQDAAYLDELTNTYLIPLMPAYGILWRDWQTAQNIPADDLVNFCAYNNLLNLPLEPAESTIRWGAEYLDSHGPAEQVEAAVRQYFDVPVEYLRTSQWYNYVDESTNTTYDNEYIMLYGFGGGGMTRALQAQQDGDLLRIMVGLYGPDDEADRPRRTGMLTIRLEEDGDYKYVSNILEE